MDDKIGVNPFDEEKPRSPLITLAILGLGLAVCCVVFIAAFIFFKPDQLSLVDKYFPSPTATSTSTPTPTPTPNLTATQEVIRSTKTAQAIQILATDSISQWKILLSEPFDSNTNKWPTGKFDDEYSSSTREIKNGKYNWDVTAKQGFFEWAPSNKGYAAGDFHLSAEMKRAGGSSQSDYGLVFREKSNGDLYFFGINENKFFVTLNYGDEWTTLIESAESPAILPEGTNLLTVIAEGSHFIFFINNQYVGEMTDDHIKNSSAAIGVELYDAGLQATFEFDNFELRAP